MEEPVKEEKYHGYTIKIYQDPDPMNPRTEFDEFGKMICFHRRYDLGDKHDMSVEELQELVERKDVVALPLYLYDHSGITMRTRPFGDPWDSGQVGYIYADAGMIKKEYGSVTAATKEKARKLMQGEVETYDDYLTGNVYGYVIENPDGEHVDSCWGFYGGTDEAFKEAKALVKGLPWQPKLRKLGKGRVKRAKRAAAQAGIRGVR